MIFQEKIKKVNKKYIFNEVRAGFEPRTCRSADQSFIHYTTSGLLDNQVRYDHAVPSRGSQAPGAKL